MSAEAAVKGDWFVTEDDGMVLKSMRFRDEDGRMVIDVKAEIYGNDELLEQARIDRAASAGKAWGDGQVIGRLPMHLYFSSGMSEARQQGDEKWVKKFWNCSDHSRLRTFEGKV